MLLLSMVEIFSFLSFSRLSFLAQLKYVDPLEALLDNQNDITSSSEALTTNTHG